MPTGAVGTKHRWSNQCTLTGFTSTPQTETHIPGFIIRPLEEGKGAFLKSVVPGKLTMFQWKATHQGIYGEEKLS